MNTDTTKFTILKEYTNEISFSVPNLSASFHTQNKINIEVGTEIKAGRVKGDIYLSQIITTFNGNKLIVEEASGKEIHATSFLGYLSYSVLVNIIMDENPETINKDSDSVDIQIEKKNYILSVEAPKLAFPAIRHQIAKITGDAGFAPLFIDPIDFETTYLKQHSTTKIDQEKESES